MRNPTTNPHPVPARLLSGLLIIALGGLSACTTTRTTTKSEHPVGVPTQWAHTTADSSGAMDTADLATWWRGFGDPTLTQLIESALTTSPDVRTALAKVEEARARYKVERSNFWPSVTASASDRTSRTTVRDTNATTQTESASASLDASWEIDLFGRERLTAKASAADLAESEENLHDAQVTLAAEVASTYVSLREAESEIATVEASVKTRQETLQLTRWREQAGTVSALETQQAVTSLEQARSSLPSLQQTLTEARNKLALLCGQAPGALDQVLSSTAKVPDAPSTLATGIPAETLRQRPDVRAAGHAVEAAVARTSASERSRFPTLSLTGSLGVDALSAGKLFSPESTFSSLVGGLTAPIFTAGSISQTIQIQSAAEKQTLIAYESTVLNALSEVENALSSIQRTSDQLTLLERATAAARESATLARQQYDAGQTDFLTVLDSERTLLGLEQNLVATKASLTSAHIQLYKALGGGWSAGTPNT